LISSRVPEELVDQIGVLESEKFSTSRLSVLVEHRQLPMAI
jgi:hypothetical protein